MESSGGAARQEQPSDHLIDLDVAATVAIDDVEPVGPLGKPRDPHLDVAPVGLDAPGVSAAAIARAGVGSFVARGLEDLVALGLETLLDELLDECRDLAGDVVPERPSEVGDELDDGGLFTGRFLLSC